MSAVSVDLSAMQRYVGSIYCKDSGKRRGRWLVERAVPVTVMGSTYAGVLLVRQDGRGEQVRLAWAHFRRWLERARAVRNE